VNISNGTLLDGRVRYDQPATGYRTGIEPVLLAASVAAQPGEHILEAGTGAGAGLLCLAARVPGIIGMGVERDPALSALARDNAAANGFDALTIDQADIVSWRTDRAYDHAFANPPWHDQAGTASPEPSRIAAKQSRDGLLTAWTSTIARALRPRGSLSLILPAASLAEGVAALVRAECPEIRLMPLWPHLGEPAKLIILRGIRLGRGRCEVGFGLVLHEGGGGFTAEADGILRGGGAFTA
jgi:tRNA1(Val) A37 N6-methylase TrmN6